jgi:DNA modification methylase
MHQTQVRKTLSSRIIKTAPVNWRALLFIQNNDFKDWTLEAKQRLRNSILANRFSQPFYVWQKPDTCDIFCLDGMHRHLILQELAAEGMEIPLELPATFIECQDKKEAALLVAIYSSIYARVTQQGLVDFIQQYDLSFDEMKTVIDLPGMDMVDLEASMKPLQDGDRNAIPTAQSLQERFIIPPFSIFDTRQGYWQERKKQWHALGINSQETRENVNLIAKSGQPPAVYALRNDMREKLQREPEWDEIIAYAREKGMHLYEGASIFDPVLAEIAYTWFNVPGGSILDPFAGGSVRGIVAGYLGYNYTGIDLRPDQVEANEKQWRAMNLKLASASAIGWVSGDSNEVLNHMKEEFDLLFSCPPYHDLEQYSDDLADLSNMDYPAFLTVYRSIVIKSVARLKDNRFACFVVGDIRDKAGRYRNFVSATIEAFREAGMCLYNEIILVNVAGSMPMRIGRQFEGGRKVGKVHQNVLVFYKGDPKKISQVYPRIELTAELTMAEDAVSVD